MTIIDVETTLFPRVTLDHVGFGGIGTTYLFGPNDSAARRRRPAGRLRIHRACRSSTARANGSGARCTIPRRSRSRPSSTVRRRASGCCSATANYDAFQDDDQRFERRPSLWIEPLGDWGPGQRAAPRDPDAIPRSTTTSSPIGARRRRWRRVPKSPSRIGSTGAGCRPSGRRSRPSADCGSAAASAGRRRRFIVDFTGDMLGDDAPRERSSPS